MLLGFAGNAQDTGAVDQVQAVVHGIHTPQQAMHVDHVIRAMSGVLVSRTDPTTRNLFLLVRADAALDPDAIRAKLAPMGLALSCWTRRARPATPFAPLDPAECEPGPASK